MSRIRHLAISTQDPDKMRHFFETAFGFETLRAHDSERAEGFMMSDGAINVAVLKFHTDQLGKGMDYVGLHHFGVQVEDADACVDRVLELGSEVFVDEMELSPLQDGRAKRPDKFRGVEGLVFDVADQPWPGTDIAK
ncbi:VOC family protein [Streptomyces sp. 5-6(2022)]|uniref:VOC family protein n=1 Tax=Streptomyces sp. 5-6(2022) TaxID=2936510 RepID=UPI0023B958BE|nr:VOC family protein [Streptomyces sp. 5-6(2022)]